MSFTTKISAFVSKVLALITPKVVEIGGFSLATAGAILLHGHVREVVLVAEGVYLLDRFKPAVFNAIKSFANPTTWPGYVSMGLATVVAAHSGGNPASLVAAGVLATGVGRLFNQLY